MANCSFQWWHAPIFFTISVVLAFFAISTALRSSSAATSASATTTTQPISDELSLNASKALRKAGFNTIATLLQISPEHFFSPQNSTIFAIKDSAISNTSLPPWLLKNLVQYHTSPSKLSMADLLNKPQGLCLPTLFRTKKIAITRMDSTARLVEINHVLVTDPDIFLGGNVSIHGVLAPFSPLDPLDLRQGWSFIQAPFCDSNATLVSDPRLCTAEFGFCRISVAGSEASGEASHSSSNGFLQITRIAAGENFAQDARLRPRSRGLRWS